MTALRYLLLFVTLGVLGLALALFLGQNMHAERLAFFGLDYTTNMVWVLLGAAAFGAVVMLALVLPGRLAAALHAWSVEREMRYAEHDLQRLQDRGDRLLERHEDLLDAHERLLQRHQRLLAEHSQVVAERDEALGRLSAGASVKAIGGRAAQALLPAPSAARERAKASNLAIVAPAADSVSLQPERQGAPAPLAAASPPDRRERSLPAAEVRASSPIAASAGEDEEPERQPRVTERARQVLSRMWPLAATPSEPSEPVEAAPADPTDLPHPIRRLGGSATQALAAVRQRVRDDLARSAALPAALGGAVTTTRTRLKQLTLPGRLSGASALTTTNEATEDAPESDDDL